MDGISVACDDVSGKKMESRSKGDTCRWNEEVKEAVSRKKEAHKVMCHNSTDENNCRYKIMNNYAKKAVSKVMREKAGEALSELRKLTKWDA